MQSDDTHMLSIRLGKAEIELRTRSAWLIVSITATMTLVITAASLIYVTQIQL